MTHLEKCALIQEHRKLILDYRGNISALSSLISTARIDAELCDFNEDLVTCSEGSFIKFILGKNEIAIFATYFLTPIFTLLSGILLASFLKKYFTSFYYIISGGR